MISLKFTKRNGKLSLCAYAPGSGPRHYKTVEGLKSVNFDTWNDTDQCFTSRSKNDKYNNQVLAETLKKYQQLLATHDFESGSELFAFDREQKKAVVIPIQQQEPKGITLGEWVEKIIEEIKNPTRLKPSSSYQGYLTLLHKLEKEKYLIKTPVSELNDDSFVQLINWVLKNNSRNSKGGNYIGTMKIFRAVISRAKKARLTTYTPDFPYMDYAPITHQISEKATDIIFNGGTVNSLTREQIEEFKNLDVDTPLISREAKMVYYNNMYKDFAILLYELKSRPIDVVKLHWDNLAVDPRTGKYTLTYVPAKKKNYGKSARHTSSPLVVQYLTPEAVRIVLKYKGMSKGGYVFPFPLNDRKWNLDNPEHYHYHYYKANHICGAINKFLHRDIRKISNWLFCSVINFL